MLLSSEEKVTKLLSENEILGNNNIKANLLLSASRNLFSNSGFNLGTYLKQEHPENLLYNGKYIFINCEN